jgi:hypothetical protein
MAPKGRSLICGHAFKTWICRHIAGHDGAGTRIEERVSKGRLWE